MEIGNTVFVQGSGVSARMYRAGCSRGAAVGRLVHHQQYLEISPDGTKTAFFRAGNLWVAFLNTGR